MARRRRRSSSSSSGALRAVAALCVGPEATSTESAAAKPHIILHLADDFGWANAGWHRPDDGYAEVQTPHMDALVKEGIELDHAVRPTRRLFSTY